MTIFATPRLLPLADQAVTVQFGDETSAAASARVLGFERALAQAVAEGRIAGVTEWLPAFASVTVIVDDADEAAAAVRDAALQALAEGAPPRAAAGRHWRLPACFDAEFAPDLAGVAAARGMTPAEVVERLCAARLEVRMLGFLPGFPYLGGLPPELERPRLASPRAAVPERSVAIAGLMCAVYPWTSPGGWHLVGRTPVRLFEATAEEPALLRAGDTLQWQPVDRARYDELDRRAGAGDLPRDAWQAVERAA